MKLGIVVFFKVLIQNFKGAAILGHVIDDVSSWYKWNFLLTKQVILYTVGKQILRWLTFSEEPYPENQFTVELCVMTMKNDTKIDEELTCRFKIDMRNFTNFDTSTQKPKYFFVLISSLWPKYKLFELKKYREVMFDGLNIDVKFEEKLTCCLENDTRNLPNFDQSTQKCQNWNFDGIFLFKVENAWA